MGKPAPAELYRQLEESTAEIDKIRKWAEKAVTALEMAPKNHDHDCRRVNWHESAEDCVCWQNKKNRLLESSQATLRQLQELEARTAATLAKVRLLMAETDKND